MRRVLSFLALTGCIGDTTTPPGDGGSDATADSSSDAHLDVALEAGGDASDGGACISGIISLWRGENNLTDTFSINPLVSNNGVAYGTGKIGQAFLLSTSAASVYNTNFPAVGISTTALTVEGWVNPTTNKNMVILTHHAQNGSGSWEMHLLGLKPGFTTAGGGAASPNVIPMSLFTHIAITCDTSGANVYVNGTLAAGGSGACVPGDEGLGLRMGLAINGDGSTGDFDGVIDELAIYNRALGANEIASIYAAEVSGNVPCRKP